MHKIKLVSAGMILSIAFLAVGIGYYEPGLWAVGKPVNAAESAGQSQAPDSIKHGMVQGMSIDHEMSMVQTMDMNNGPSQSMPQDNVTSSISSFSGPLGGSSGRILTVAPGKGQYKTIAEAVSAAKAGDTIVIRNGIYHEHIVLKKPLKLQGEGNPVLDGDGEGDVLTLLADGCVVTSLEIRNSGLDQSQDQAGIKIKSSHNVIEYNQLLENLMGVYLYHSNDNTVSNNKVHGRLQLSQSLRGNGIHLWNSNDNKIESNDLTSNRDGLYFSFANHNIIAKNSAYGQRVGIHYMYSNDNKLLGNLLHDNIDGIAMMFSQNNTLQSNKVYHNQDDGIVFKEMDNNVLQKNVVYNNRTGITMDNANNNKVTGNLLAANLTGLDFTAGSDVNLFTGNSWEQNQEQVSMTDSGHNRWDDGQQGNYWSDYTGNDLNNDGIGDQPYWQNNLSEYLVKQFPMVKLLFNSPALQAVAAAEKAFPVLHPPGAVDNFPLIAPSINSAGLSIDWKPYFPVLPSEQSDLMAM